MRRILVVLALLVSGTLLGAPQAAAAELAVNGGFESGSLSPWTCSGNLGTVVTTPVHSGTRALQAAVSGSDNARCSQTVNGLVSGTAYTLSGWFRGSYTYLGINGGASTWTPGGATWTKLTINFNATSTSVQIYTHGWYGQGTYHADDISLEGQGSGGQVPGPPGNLQSTAATNNSISLSWTASSGTVTGYRVYEGATQVATGTGLTATIGSLGTCTSHTYVVRGYNASGESTNSNSVTASTTGCGGTVPGAPTSLQVTGTTANSISLSWAVSSGTVTGYRVYEGSTQVAQVTGTTATIGSLVSCTSHTYTARAYNANGESANSNAVTGSTTGCTTLPGAPGNPQVTGTTGNSISLSWTASSGTVTGYRVYEGTTQMAQVTGLTATIGSLGACTTHTYTVRAYNANGEGPSSAQVIGSTTGCTSGNKLLGYFVQWGIYQRGYHVKNIHTSGSAAKLTHINYAFGNVQGGACTIGDAYADYDRFYGAGESVNGVADTWDAGALRGNFGQLRRLKAMYPHLKVLFSFGGWTWSGGFGAAAANPTAFANSCYNLVEDPRWADVFDGIDIDWEYPNACGLTCDTSGFASFKTVSAALRARFGANNLVTAAITADGNPGGKIDAADYGGAAQYHDWYNVMTYDFFGGWAATGPTAPHSPLNCYSGIPIAGFCTENAIAKLKSKGIPSSKLLLGIGFYGRGWTGVTQSAPGGTATGPAPGTYEQGIEDYKVISTRCAPTGTVGGTSYSYCGNQWWSFDTPSTIGSKMSWTKGQGLGGAFFWELSGDTSGGTLITAMKNGLA